VLLAQVDPDMVGVLGKQKAR